VSRVLVSGGAGYIGSHAVRALVDAGHAAVPSAVPLVQGDMHDTALVMRALADHRIDAVMHFAAWLDVGASVGNPLGYYHNNVAGTLSVLEAMRQAGVTRFVFSSTCAVYGEPPRVPMDETLDTRPINAYGETKLAIERALPHLERAHGIRWTALRYFNAAGAQPDGTIGEDHAHEIHLIPRAIIAATGGPALKVFGEDYPTPDGTCLRDYIHVCDLADAHVRALAALDQGGASAIYNVGTGTPHSVRSVIDAVSRTVGAAVRWESAARRPGDPSALYASSHRIQEALGWQPRYGDLDTIVQHAWRWHASHPRGYEDHPSRHD
jgi:UDP-glucose-4-epimerase GalE